MPIVFTPMAMPAQLTRIRGSPSLAATSASAAVPLSALLTSHLDGNTTDLGRDLGGAVNTHVEDGDARALGGQRARRCLAKAGAAAGDDRDLAVGVHDVIL